ncbi:hypothetical protein HYR69_06325 [Candidatus Sumerlaeota bacterium]|nr:hypothetical protein [Candidatus Sumerlaeota bacterium]
MKLKSLYFLLVFLLLAAGCGGARMKILDHGKFKRRPSIYPIDLYEGKVIESHREIAIIDSTAYPSNPNDDPKTKEKMFSELKIRARKVGADAVHDVRILTKRIEGYTIDERAPFPAWQQGEYPLYFLRGTAIAYESGMPGAVAKGSGYNAEPEGFTRAPQPAKPEEKNQATIHSGSKGKGKGKGKKESKKKETKPKQEEKKDAAPPAPNPPEAPLEEPPPPKSEDLPKP